MAFEYVIVNLQLPDQPPLYSVIYLVSPFATVIGYPIMYPGTSTPNVGLNDEDCVKVTLATPYVASIEIVHFLFVPKTELLTNGLAGIPS